jgi:hypothetical protein
MRNLELLTGKPPALILASAGGFNLPAQGQWWFVDFILRARVDNWSLRSPLLFLWAIDLRVVRILEFPLICAED